MFLTYVSWSYFKVKFYYVAAILLCISGWIVDDCYGKAMGEKAIIN